MKKMLISKQNGIPSLLSVLLVGGPLVLGQDSLQHGAVQGSLDAESPSVKEVLSEISVQHNIIINIGASQLVMLIHDNCMWERGRFRDSGFRNLPLPGAA